MQQSCRNQVGTGGITVADCQEVTDAVTATDMNLQPTAASATEAPVCNPGFQRRPIFVDNLENPRSGNWVKQTFVGRNNWYYPQTPNLFSPGFDPTYATSGDTNFWGYDFYERGDYAITRRGFVRVPASGFTYLRFRHSYGFDDETYPSQRAYDGGVLEFQASGTGGKWVGAESLFTHNGFDGTIASGNGNPLEGRRGFVRESNGYISSQVELSQFEGRSVKWRYRIGTDASVDDYGWFIDDISVYNCTR